MSKQKNAQVVTVRLPIDEYEMLRTFAFVTKAKINEVVRKAVLSFLAQEGRQEEIDAIIDRVRQSRRQALDKLAEM